MSLGCQQSSEATTTSTEPEQLVLRLRPAQPKRRVTFSADTVDNEHLGRQKSNCCCIYVKPRVWNDPSTWVQDEDETEHCRGHTLEKKKEDELE